MFIPRTCFVLVQIMLFSVGFGQLVTQTIIPDLLRIETICDDVYGTILARYFKMQHPAHCAMKCVKNPLSQSATYNWRSNLCHLNSDFFENRTMFDCSNYVGYIFVSTEIEPRQYVADGCVAPVNTAQVEYTTSPSGLIPVGSSIPYICHPCTYFTPAGLLDYITCQTNGTWTEPICLYGPDEGRTYNGITIPNTAVGCGLHSMSACPIQTTGNFTYDGIGTLCFCDNTCCGAGDCCFDAPCADDYISYYFPPAA